MLDQELSIMNLPAFSSLPAKFITFEGGEGSGKSTQSKMLHEYLLAKSTKIIHTREVGGTAEAEKIRQLLVDNEWPVIAELMLVMAARCEHVNKVIWPALQNDCWVICDRFIDSTACYQGQSPLIGIDRVYRLHQELITNGLMPDITFFLDIQPELALDRTRKRLDNNRFEDKSLEYHRKVYQNFQQLAKCFKHRITVIAAAGLTSQQVHSKIITALLAAV